eukprot:2494014-Rhodomonas_salina.3
MRSRGRRPAAAALSAVAPFDGPRARGAVVRVGSGAGPYVVAGVCAVGECGAPRARPAHPQHRPALRSGPVPPCSPHAGPGVWLTSTSTSNLSWWC